MKVEVIRSARKSMSIGIEKDGRIIVRAPHRMTNKEINIQLEKHRAWIEKHLAEYEARARAEESIPKMTNEELQEIGNQAVKDIPERVEHYAALVGVNYGRITIRCQKSRWGSCSSKGNLNFNCLLMLAPEDVINYVVVHELCHRKEMNHSTRFWAEVERVLPDYRRPKKWLKEHGSELMARVSRP